MFFPELVPDSPVPVCPETVSPAKEHSQACPGNDCSEHNNQMEFAGLWKNPSAKSKENDRDMRNVEENIQKGEQQITTPTPRAGAGIQGVL